MPKLNPPSKTLPKKFKSVPLDETPEFFQILRFVFPKDFCSRSVNQVLNTNTGNGINFLNPLFRDKKIVQILLQRTHTLLELSIAKTHEPFASLEVEGSPTPLEPLAPL